jgi:hypothetical protein
MFERYEDIEPEFQVTIAHNGFTLSIRAKEKGKEDTWQQDRVFVFTTDQELFNAINLLTELV